MRVCACARARARVRARARAHARSRARARARGRVGAWARGRVGPHVTVNQSVIRDNCSALTKTLLLISRMSACGWANLVLSLGLGKRLQDDGWSQRCQAPAKPGRGSLPTAGAAYGLESEARDCVHVVRPAPMCEDQARGTPQVHQVINLAPCLIPAAASNNNQAFRLSI